MPTTPRGPRLLKGALVAVDLANGNSQTTIAFQYNPDTLRRTLTPQMAGGEKGQRSETLRLTGAPEETLNLEVIVDAIDQLESGKGSDGIHPQLAAMEMLLYPQSSQVQADNKLLDQGKMEIGAPYDAPMVLFVWGPKRVLPVMLTTVSVTEEEFDSSLNPIRARVSLGMRALSYSDLSPAHKGYDLFLAYQKSKERLARKGTAEDPTKLVGFDVAGRIG